MPIFTCSLSNIRFAGRVGTMVARRVCADALLHAPTSPQQLQAVKKAGRWPCYDAVRNPLHQPAWVCLNEFSLRAYGFRITFLLNQVPSFVLDPHLLVHVKDDGCDVRKCRKPESHVKNLRPKP